MASATSVVGRVLPPCAAPKPNVKSRRSWVLPMLASTIAGIVEVGSWNPWNLVVIAWLDQPVLGAIVIWLLIVGWLSIAKRLLAVRVVGILILAGVGLLALVVGPLFIPMSPYGREQRLMPGTDIRLVVDELPGIPGKRIDVLTLESDRGIASRRNRVTTIRGDQMVVTVSLATPSTLVIHECYVDRTFVIDSETLDVVSSSEAPAPAERRTLPPADLKLPFAAPPNKYGDCPGK